MAPADSTTRSASRMAGPFGPRVSTPTTRVPDIRSRSTLVWVSTVRLDRVGGGFQERRAGAGADTVDDVQRHRPDSGRGVLPGRLGVEVR